MGAETFLEDLRDSVVAMTEADPYFLDVPIITEELGDISSRIQATVGKLTGICILVITPGVEGALPNVPGANYTGIVIAARVFENRKINKTGKHALAIAIKLADLWSQMKPDTASATLKPQTRPIQLGNDDRYTTYDVYFETEAGIKAPIPRLAAPQLDPTDLAAVTLSTATPGAATFFTLDGSAPIPRNPAAALYLASFAATAGQTLRARSWLAGYLPSPEKKQIL